MNVAPAASASLSGSMAIQNRVVVSPRVSFPWTLDALQSSRLISRQLKVMAKNGVQPCAAVLRFDVHEDCVSEPTFSRIALSTSVATSCACLTVRLGSTVM
jgi:hypothetical protein